VSVLPDDTYLRTKKYQFGYFWNFWHWNGKCVYISLISIWSILQPFGKWSSCAICFKEKVVLSLERDGLGHILVDFVTKYGHPFGIEKL
jgi:hypothetical protein